MLRANRLISLSAALIALFILTITGCSSTEVRLGPDNSSSDSAALKITVISQTNSPLPETNLLIDLARAGVVYFEVTNATGHHVRTLVDGYIEAGSHIIEWDGSNDDGDEIDPGIYLFHLTSGDLDIWRPFAFAISVDDEGVE